MGHHAGKLQGTEHPVCPRAWPGTTRGPAPSARISHGVSGEKTGSRRAVAGHQEQASFSVRSAPVLDPRVCAVPPSARPCVLSTSQLQGLPRPRCRGGRGTLPDRVIREFNDLGLGRLFDNLRRHGPLLRRHALGLADRPDLDCPAPLARWATDLACRRELPVRTPPGKMIPKSDEPMHRCDPLTTGFQPVAAVSPIAPSVRNEQAEETALKRWGTRAQETTGR